MVNQGNSALTGVGLGRSILKGRLVALLLCSANINRSIVHNEDASNGALGAC